MRKCTGEYTECIGEHFYGQGVFGCGYYNSELECCTYDESEND